MAFDLNMSPDPSLHDDKDGYPAQYAQHAADEANEDYYIKDGRSETDGEEHVDHQRSYLLASLGGFCFGISGFIMSE